MPCGSPNTKARSRSWTDYYRPRRPGAREQALQKRIIDLCEEFPRYGYRRVTHQLRAAGLLINHKAVARIMRQRQLQVRPLRRFVRTTNSDHDNPGFPNLAADATPTAAKQLWVADLTYVAIAVGFVYVAVILDAWSRRVVGYALARRIDTRLTLAALHAAVAARRPPPGCISPFGSRRPVRRRALSRYPRRVGPARFNGPAGQPLPQRQGREHPARFERTSPLVVAGPDFRQLRSGPCSRGARLVSFLLAWSAAASES
jgi:putative transposase